MMEFLLRVTCDTDQPQPFVECAAAAAVKQILDGWTDNPKAVVARFAGDPALN